MHVEEIEGSGLRDFQHLGRKRKRVRGMVEKRVSGHFHFVEENALGCGAAQTNRHGVAYKVDLVTARRQFNAQFRRHYT